MASEERKLSVNEQLARALRLPLTGADDGHQEDFARLADAIDSLPADAPDVHTIGGVNGTDFIELDDDDITEIKRRYRSGQ